VLFTFDDLQWSELVIDEIMTDFVVNYIRVNPGFPDKACRRGLLIAGTFRSNEVAESNDLMHTIGTLKECGRVNVTMLTIDVLSKVDVTKLLSSKLYLPLRYTRELAELVQIKTRGNPFFVVEFLRSIIRKKMLLFSVKSRRWTWDCDVVDMQMISDGVAQLLTATFGQLPSTLMQTLKVLSCLGSQVEESTIDALDFRNEVIPFNMWIELPAAVKEGILERAGPVYQFTHDIVRQTIYDLIPPDDRKLLHKNIGKTLLKSTANNPSVHNLAIDQINIFCKDCIPSPEECQIFAQSNAAAAKFAVSASSFEQGEILLLQT
jgi:predicted ATPase